MRKLTEREVKEAITRIHGDRFDLSKLTYINNRTPVIIIHNGVEYTYSPKKLLKGEIPKELSIYQRGTREEFIEKATAIHGNKYDYSMVDYTNSKTKIKIICKEHGIFEQIPYSHLNGNVSCKQCKQISFSSNSPLKYNKSIFTEKATTIHGNKYDYSMVDYTNSQTKIKIICPIHGVFEQMPYSHLNGNGCSKCVSHISHAEMSICNLIKNEYIQSSRSIIPPLELDIYIPSKNLAIEYNGLYWHCEQQGKDKKYHLNKTIQCEEKGIQLIHIFEDEWIHKPKIVRSRLRNLTGCIKRSIYARKCQVREIDTKTKGKFLDKYHIQGNDKSRVKLGLFYKDYLVAVMTFGKSRYSKTTEWELIRYCTISNFRVIGGAGKLLKHFEREHNPKSLVSYADRRWSQGKVYKALGFNHSHNSTPNYFYIDTAQHRSSRVKYQKHKLKDKLEVFDETKTEYQNMLMNSIDRIWDCGNMVFIKEY